MMESMSNIEVRKINRANIVELLLAEDSLTKAEITNRLGLSLATVNVLLKELLEEGVVEKGAVLQSTGGRRPTLFQAVSSYKVVIGAELTRNHIRLAYVNWKLEVLNCKRIAINYCNQKEYWETVREYILEFLKENNLEEETLQGISFSVNSTIKSVGSVEDIVPIGDFEGLETERVKKMFHCPVYFLDTIKAAAFSHIGTKKNKESWVYLHLDDYVGGGLINYGNFYGLQGSRRSGEFGSMIFGFENENGIQSAFSNKGKTLQSHCSSQVIREKANSSLHEYFEKLGKEENPQADAIWKEYIYYLAVALYNLRVIFDHKIMIGGEMSRYINERKETLLQILSENDIYKEEVDYIYFSEGEEFDSAIGGGFIVLEKNDELKK